MIYAIHRKTKEHFVSGITENHPIFASRNGAHAFDCDDYYYVKADADGWIEWHPRDGQPVQDSQLVDVKCSSQYWEDASGIEASAVGWSKLSTVTHYRPILDPQAEQAKEWRGPEDGLPPVGTLCEYTLGECSPWFECEVISHNRLVIHCPHLMDDEQNGLQAIHTNSFIKFRPIRNYRERWIEAAYKIVEEKRSLEAWADTLGRIYDAGLAKLPEQTK